MIYGKLLELQLRQKPGRTKKITSEPSDFATNAPFANDSNNLPVWGTCP